MQNAETKTSPFEIVSHETFPDVLKSLLVKHVLAVDTETTGLRVHHGDVLFSIIVASADQTFYFNFNEYEDLDPNVLLGPIEFEGLKELFAQPKLWFFANAKFDIGMLAKEGITVGGLIHDVIVVGRLLDNSLGSLREYSLGKLAKRIGLEKIDAVERQIEQHKLYTLEQIPGKKRIQKRPHFNLVPFDVIAPYGSQDARITFQVGMDQRIELDRLEHNRMETKKPSIFDVYKNEAALVHNLLDMERLGVLIDKDFCQKAITYQDHRAETAKAAFKDGTGIEYKNSGKLFRQLFEGEVFTYGKPTKKKGVVNPKFDSEVLATFKHPAARHILELRDAKANSDFYNGFLWHSDSESRVHSNFNQSGTATGRFSSSDPNLQNLTKDEGEDLKNEFVVRRAFVPSAGFFFAMFDMDQAEYRLMLDYAGAMGLIEKVLGGLDVHQATADLAGIKRGQAKNCNFARLYGAGIAKMAKMLKCSEAEARAIVAAIDAAAPEIDQFIRLVINRAEKGGEIYNWMGRRFLFPDASKAYKAPNYLIQGGVGDIVKVSMNRVQDFLRGRKSRLILNVHDELDIECHESESGILPEIKHILEGVYKHRHLPLTWGCDHSFKSLADRVKGFPT